VSAPGVYPVQDKKPVDKNAAIGKYIIPLGAAWFKGFRCFRF
jgi:hypothetical protein